MGKKLLSKRVLKRWEELLKAPAEPAVPPGRERGPFLFCSSPPKVAIETPLSFQPPALPSGVRSRATNVITQLRIAIEQNPNDAGLHQTLGQAYYQQRLFDQATAEFQKSLELDPKSSPVHHALGLAWMRMGKFPQAQEALFAGCSLSPKDPDLNYN